MSPEDQIREALTLLFQKGSVVELRALGERTHYGYYTDHDKLARDAAILDATPGIENLPGSLASPCIGIGQNPFCQKYPVHELAKPAELYHAPRSRQIHSPPAPIPAGAGRYRWYDRDPGRETGF